MQRLAQCLAWSGLVLGCGSSARAVDGGTMLDASSASPIDGLAPGAGILPDGGLGACAEVTDDAGGDYVAGYPAVCCNGTPLTGGVPWLLSTAGICGDETAAECILCVPQNHPDGGVGELCKRGNSCSYDPSAGPGSLNAQNPNLEGWCYASCRAGGFSDCSCDPSNGGSDLCVCYP
jgi:hypothetical protein